MAAAALAPLAAFATDRLFPARLRHQGARAWAASASRCRRTRSRAATNPAGMVFIGNRADVGLDVVPARPQTRDHRQRLSGRERHLRRQRHARASCFPSSATTVCIQPEPRARRLGVRQRRHEHDLQDLALYRLRRQQPRGRGPDPVVHRADARLQDRLRTIRSACRSFSPTRSSRPTAWARSRRVRLAGQRHQPRRRPFHRLGAELGWTGKVTRSRDAGRDLPDQDRHGQVRQVQGSVRRRRGLRYSGDLRSGHRLVKAMPKLTLAGDIQRINYGDVPSVGNPVDCFFAGTCMLGASNGPGFGWRNTTVYKIGVSYELVQGSDAARRLRDPAPADPVESDIVQYPRAWRGRRPPDHRRHLGRRREQGIDARLHARVRARRSTARTRFRPDFRRGFGGGEANLQHEPGLARHRLRLEDVGSRPAAGGFTTGRSDPALFML